MDFEMTSVNPVPNAQVFVYWTVHYICAKKVYYSSMCGVIYFFISLFSEISLVKIMASRA
jgi:hypothetical protein